MNLKKTLLWVIGTLSAMMLVAGISLILLPKTVAVVVGVVVSCLSLATGLILADPLSIIGLVLGILLAFASKGIMGAILIAIGIIGAFVPPIISLRLKKEVEDDTESCL